MTRRERRSRPDRPSLERSLDALLDGGWPGRDGPGPGGPGDDPARWQPVAQVLAALTSAPESSELAAEARALAEFRALADRPARTSGAQLPPQPPQRDPGWKTWPRPGRPAWAAAGAVLVGGLLAVAYAGDLPAAAQQLAHDTIDAPAAGRSARPDQVGPTPPPSPAADRSQPDRPGRRGDHASARTDRRTSHGSGSRHQHQPSSSPPGTSGYRTSRSPDPSRSRPVRQPRRFSHAPAQPAAFAVGERQPSGQRDPVALGRAQPEPPVPAAPPAAEPVRHPEPSPLTTRRLLSPRRVPCGGPGPNPPGDSARRTPRVKDRRLKDQRQEASAGETGVSDGS